MTVLYSCVSVERLQLT